MPRPRAELLAILQAGAREIAGAGAVDVVTMRQDASNRSYHRVTIQGGAPGTLVVMELGDARPEEATKGPASAELAFLDVQRFLRHGGIEVPDVWRHDTEHGLIYLEDLGDQTMESLVANAHPGDRRAYYLAAIQELARIQEYASRQDGTCVAFSRSFDHDLLRWELDHFREWLLEAQRGVVLAASERSALDAAFDRIAQELAAAPRLFVHRDYQSRNLMVTSVKPNISLKIIDFQDALLGPLPYDLVALLRDSYVQLSFDEVLDLGNRYLELRPQPIGREAYWRLFHLQTVQRKLKDSGRFVFIERKKNNPSFLPFVGPSLLYVREALVRLEGLEPLHALLARYLPELDSPPPSPTEA